MNIYEYLRFQGQIPGAQMLREQVQRSALGGPMPANGPPMAMAPAPGGPPIPMAPLSAPQRPKPTGGFLGGVDRLLGGTAMQGLSPENAADARRQGLLAAGAQMMLASGRHIGPRTSLTEIMAQGLLAGQQGYGQGIQQGYGQQMEAASMERRARLQQVLTPRPGETLQDTYARLNEAAGLAAGDESTQGMVPQIVQAMKDLPQQFGGPKQDFGTVELADGRRQTIVNGQPVGEPWGPKKAATSGLSEYQQTLAENRRILGENALADDYRAQTKDIQTAADNYGIITSSSDAAMRGDAAAQIAMVFAFMKMQDPGSVVRESEYATAENARGVAEDVRNMYNRLLKGTRLTPEQVQRFTAQAGRSVGYWRRRQDSTQAQYRRRIESRDYNPDNVLFDYFGAVPGADGASDTGPPPAFMDMGDPFAEEAPAVPTPPAERQGMMSADEVRRQALQREMAKWLHPNRTTHSGGR